MDRSEFSTSNADEFLAGKTPSDFIVAGIGASAGGIQALKIFFENVPANSGIAYVVILHLSPDHDSKLAELLQTVSKMPVMQVTEKTAVKSDHVYVVPPNQHLLMLEGHIAVSSNTQIEDRRAPVDIFFRTLADTHGPNAVCVTLSGTGANGSMGLKRIKEMGGAAFVQSPREAEFNEMPRNSIATNLVDAVLPVAEIPAYIIAYKARLQTSFISVDAEKRPEDQQHALREVFTQLRLRTGHDFTNYKRPTLLRRIERRINICNLPDLGAYANYMQQNPEETTALLKDLLISVTNFFRDKKAFEAIENEVIPAIIRNKTAEHQVRIWVAGCATGEEAYSLAILCAEHTLNSIDAPKIQIFATDIDEAAILQAREGLYTINDAADVSPERLRRFFNKEGDEYRIRREIREMILFANHNFIKDPPFSHLDMVSCRNVLIYLNNTAQERVMETFHFALSPGAYLFLGSSESADGANDLFAPSNRECHIFQKRQVTSARAYPVPESIPATFKFENAPKPNSLLEQPATQIERITFGDLHQRLLEQYGPPSVIINEEYDIVHLSERAGRYLQVGGGEPSQNLLKLVRQELRLELRSALYQAVQRHTAVETRNLKVTVEDKTETITMHVRPVLQTSDAARGFILVLFERIEDAEITDVVLSSDEPVARQLEEELIRLKTQLRASNEQHEFHAEELKASNEELQAMNEELRSAAEELETSKEELQSINEELRTVNQELKVKVEETTLASNNLHNLINSVDIGTIFLDRSFRVAFFTPAARQLFNLIPADYGRELSDITGKLAYDNLLADAELVLQKLQSVEREVSTTDGRVFMMRVLPYRTAEDRINGVVVTFIDVTSRMQTEEALRASEERMRLLIESAKDYAIFTFDKERRVNSWNTGAEAMMGYTEQEIIGQQADLLFVPEDRAKNAPIMEVEKAANKGFAANERWHLRKDGSRFYGSGTVRPLHDGSAKLLGFVKIMRDLTEAKRDEQSKYFLASIVQSSDDAIMTVDFDNTITSWNNAAEHLYGYKAEEVIGKSMLVVVLPDDIRALLNNTQRIIQSRKVETYDIIRLHKDGQHINLEVTLSPIKDAKGEIIGVSTISRDTTTRKQLEQQKDEFIAIASHELKTPVTSIKGYAEILQDRFDKAKDGDNKNLMQKLISQVDRLTNLMNDLLDTSNLSETNIKLHRTTFDINEVIDAQVGQFQLASPKHTIVFQHNKLRNISADKERIEQVITNLTSNAIKYSPDGGEIVITTQAVDDGIQVSITDPGLGIPEEFTHKVFDRFFRVNNLPEQRLPGMGLGLYISAKIIHHHGGVIDVVSKPGEGSTFYFKLPYAKNDRHKLG
jgi:two-component system CheB/CheR fusion protein